MHHLVRVDANHDVINRAVHRAEPVPDAGGNNDDVASIPFPLQLQDYAPGIFTSAGTLGLISHLNGTAVSMTNPAQPGEALSLQAVGLGPTMPLIATGIPAPASPVATTVATRNMSQSRPGRTSSRSAWWSSVTLTPAIAGGQRAVMSCERGAQPWAWTSAQPRLMSRSWKRALARACGAPCGRSSGAPA
jgi:hypothetical protein